jgi:hypothetical protein
VRRTWYPQCTLCGPGMRIACGVDMDAKVWELAFIAVIACLGLGLAWAHEADFFAMFFAGATAIAAIEAVQRSL